MSEKPNILPTEIFCDMFFESVNDVKEMESIIREFVINYNAIDQGKILSYLAGVISKFKEDYKLK